MATVASQPIVYEPRSVRAAGGSPRERADSEIRGVRTTGLAEVPTGVGNPITVTIFLSNPTSQPESAEVRVRRMAGTGLTTVFYRILAVPGGEARTVDLSDLEGQTIEISVSPPDTPLVASVSVTEYFPADGGIIVRLAKYPGDFVVI